MKIAPETFILDILLRDHTYNIDNATNRNAPSTSESMKKERIF